MARSTSSGVGACPAREDLRLGQPPLDRRACLLIGDQAIRFRQEHGDKFKYWDLGEQWSRLGEIDLPFVYALWLVRPEVVDPKSIADCLPARCATKTLPGSITSSPRRKNSIENFCLRLLPGALAIQLWRKGKGRVERIPKVVRKTRAPSPKGEIEFNFLNVSCRSCRCGQKTIGVKSNRWKVDGSLHRPEKLNGGPISWSEICGAECIARLLLRKGFANIGEVEDFLRPRLKSLSDPFFAAANGRGRGPNSHRIGSK